MTNNFKNRYGVILIIVCILFVVLIGRLLDLQLRQGEEYAAQAVSGLDKELRLTGDRGMILDSTGVPLAYDQNSYNVVFYKDPSKSKISYKEDYTDIIRRTIEIVEEQGGESISSFNIYVNVSDDGTTEYKFYFSGVADDAMPDRINKWIDDMRISDDIQKEYNAGTKTVEDLYWLQRVRYGIPNDVSFEECHKVLSVWQEVQISSYRSYNPVTIAQDVSFETVAIIEMLQIQLDGMEIEESSIRIYPKNTLAAHIVGYMGRMLDETTLLEYEEIGYSREDYIGISGIESAMEFELSANIEGKTGTRVVEVNSRGKIISETSVEPATDGNNVVLTIDAKLQKKAEEALEQNIKAINSIQVARYNNLQDTYDELEPGGINEIDLAEIGGVVVMQVQTGSVLAMASYPSYDPNIFTGGLSQANADLLYNDPATPLFNKAISSSSTPGSIFKMVTALAGLMEEQITLDERISDEGLWTKTVVSGKNPRCWAYPNVQSHANQTVIEGLKNSCNYFFFEVSYRLGHELLYEWAHKLGLDSKTNVELTGEVSSQVASQATLYTSGETPTGLTAVVYYKIRDTLREACESDGLDYEDELYETVTENLMDLVVDSETSEWGPDVRGILKNDLGLDTQAIKHGEEQDYDLEIISYLLEIKWDSTENVLTGVGQSVTLLTPIGVARYVSAIVNGGYVYDATLIKSIVSPDGEVIEENRPQLIRELDVPSAYTDAIKLGMAEVVSLEDGGTAGKYFTNFKYIDYIGGKTGTAEVSDIDLENNAWFVAFAPYDEPEIAVVVMIPHGYSGGEAAYTAREILEYYLDEKYVEAYSREIPEANTVTK